ncbi:MAG: hypothetical protein IPP74_01055 [Alphaproteobacteria bacterium]|nr:hypothetical protein [Alphaproteobacteria bacterium]
MTTPKKSKYKNEWMLKYQSIEDTIAEKWGADIARFFVGERAPKIRLVKGRDKSILLASRFIKDFESLWSFSVRTNIEPYEAYEEVHLTGIHEVLALSILTLNYDIHMGNVGVVKDKNGNDIASVLDCAGAFGSRLGYEKFTRNRMNQPHLFDGMTKGDPVLPLDIVRGIHGGHYDISSSHFISLEFADKLEAFSSLSKKDLTQLQRIIHSSAKEIGNAFKHHPDTLGVAKALGRFGEAVTLNNLGYQMCEVMDRNLVAGKELALQIRLQCALIQSNIDLLDTLLTEHPTLLGKKIKWLTDDDQPQIHKPTTLYEFVTNQSIKSPEIIFTVIEHQKAREESKKQETWGRKIAQQARTRNYRTVSEQVRKPHERHQDLIKKDHKNPPGIHRE